MRLYYGIWSRKYQNNIMTQSTFFETENKEPVQGITEIAVCGYKSIYEECQIEVRSLTILAGANSSGKSSIMQPLLLMKQTLEGPYDPGGLKLDGPNVKFTSADLNPIFK
jgi:ABC-type phosphate transport system ATPase subunit